MKKSWTLLETKNLRNPDMSCFFITDESPYVLGILDSFTPDNAKLISLAPEMLDALGSVYCQCNPLYEHDQNCFMLKIETVLKKLE